MRKLEVADCHLKTSKRVLILQGLIAEAQQALKGGEAIASVDAADITWTTETKSIEPLY